MSFRRATVAVALVLVASMTASVWARCIAEPGMTSPAQMVCCQNGHDKCPMHMHSTGADCCKAEGQRHQQVTFLTHETSSSVVSPPALVVNPPAVAVAPPFVRLSQSTPHRTVLKGPDPAPYLLGSAFLV